MARQFTSTISLRSAEVKPAAWHIITSEYPPQFGGVSDYTRMVAEGLADAGDEVHVWCPSSSPSSASGVEGESVGAPPADAGGSDKPDVIVHRELGDFTPADLRRAGSLLDQYGEPRRLLVQWVPHGYGYRSMNLPFCLWLRKRAAQRRDRVELMVHEPYLAFGEGSWKQTGVAAVHRLMTAVLMQTASRVWMSIPAWEDRLRPYAFGRALEFNWLPVASNIPVVDDPAGVKVVRERYTRDGSQIVGHFGTYDRNIARLLMESVHLLLAAASRCEMLLMGRGSEQMRDQLTAKHPELAAHLHAAGTLSVRSLSLHLRACDVLLQPYVDGVSSRRTSVMVGLAHGLPIVTTQGKLTEAFWAETGAVALAPVDAVTELVREVQDLLANESKRRHVSAASKELYQGRFAVELIATALREAQI